MLGGQERLIDYIARVSPSRPPPRHLLGLIAHIERARTETTPLRLAISMPPGHAKTMTLLHAIAWWTTLTPGDTCGYVTYSDQRAMSKSRICRTMAQIGGMAISGDSNAASEWRTKEDGGVVAAGMMSGLTGVRLQGLTVVDDPYKNRLEADSDVIRERIWEALNEVVLTRLTATSPLVVCHTRWHPDDTIGRLQKEKGWTYINLPAIAEERDPLGRRVGEALWPELFPVHVLEKIRSQLGEWSFAALYQGQPRPRGHVVFGQATFCDDTSIEGYRLIIYADPAASEKTTADYGVMLCLAVKEVGDLQVAKVIDVFRAQMTVPQFARRLRAFQEQYQGAKVYVESVGAFKAVPQILRELEPAFGDNVGGFGNRNLEEDHPLGDKFQRAQPVAAAWNAGRVLVPRGKPWLSDFLAEVQTFTGVHDVHDDQVDCLSGAWNCAPREVPISYVSPAGLFKPRR